MIDLTGVTQLRSHYAVELVSVGHFVALLHLFLRLFLRFSQLLFLLLLVFYIRLS